MELNPYYTSYKLGVINDDREFYKTSAMSLQSNGTLQLPAILFNPICQSHWSQLCIIHLLLLVFAKLLGKAEAQEVTVFNVFSQRKGRLL